MSAPGTSHYGPVYRRRIGVPQDPFTEAAQNEAEECDNPGEYCHSAMRVWWELKILPAVQPEETTQDDSKTNDQR